MKKYIFQMALLCLIYTGYSQEVISTSGKYQKKDGKSISWTLGEVIIQSFASNETILLQGFQQPMFTNNSTGQIITSELDVLVYPNPATDYVIINSAQFIGLSYALYSIQGRLVLQDSLRSDQTTIQFSELPPSLYLLKIMDGVDEIQQFKIIKY